MNSPLPPLPPKYKVGDTVTFVNDYGVTWRKKVITKIVLWPEPWMACREPRWMYHYAPSDSPWCPVREDQLCLE